MSVRGDEPIKECPRPPAPPPIRKGETERGGKQLTRIQELLVEETKREYPWRGTLESLLKTVLEKLEEFCGRIPGGYVHRYASRIVMELPRIEWHFNDSNFWIEPILVVCHESDRENWLSPAGSGEGSLKYLPEVARIVARAFQRAGMKPQVITFHGGGEAPNKYFLRILILERAIGITGQDRFVAYLRFPNY